MSELAGRLSERAKTLNLPAFAADAEAAKAMQAKVISLVEERCAAFAGDAG